MRWVVRYRRPPAARDACRRAFSLAEMLIAIMLLGLGLLFIAAALPVGIDYTRRNLDSGEASAAAREALEILARQVRTSHELAARSLAGQNTYARLDAIVRPRQSDPQSPNLVFAPDDGYEPLLKVRALVMGNLLAEPVGSRRAGEPIVDPVEAIARAYVSRLVTPTAQNRYKEVDYFGSLEPVLALNPARFASAGRFHTAMRGIPRAAVHPLERVFPPVRAWSADRLNPLTLLNRPSLLWTYEPPQPGEYRAALDRRIAWTAFYRRVSYRRDPGPDGNLATPDDIPADDPLRYEFIVVITRRPTLNHRFAVQNVPGPGLRWFQQPVAAAGDALGSPYGSSCIAPVPWLVVFTGFEPQLRAGQEYAYRQVVTGPNRSQVERYLQAGFRDAQPPRLVFRCREEVGRLLPPGSVLIPARNDWYPNAAVNRLPQVGFVPSVPDGLPVYRVIERPDATTVVVDNNGYYPWISTDNWTRQSAAALPFWVIPPSFVTRDAGGQPIFEQTTPVVQVVRQVVTLTELRAPPVAGFGPTGGAP